MLKFCVTIFFLFWLAGPSFSQVVRNLQARYSIKKLKSWKLETDSTKTVIYESTTNKNDVYNENLQIDVYPAGGMDLNGCFETYFVSNLPLILQDYEAIEISEDFLNGRLVKILKFSHLFDDTPMKSTVYVLLNNDKLYYIFAMSTKEQFARYESFFFK